MPDCAENNLLARRVSDELLPFVQQPAQYIGGEVNQLVRAGDWERAEVRVALAFPDTYAIGMSHLGTQILYTICNQTPGVCAERVYCPWGDADQIMRARGLPLFTWDTRQPVAAADIFAVSLQYELCFTNLLTMLDLAGIPLLAEQRGDEHPLVIAGGPQADNPEPLADFVDLVVIGDGEPAMPAILEALREMKRAGAGRRDMIVEMARRFPWTYAPALYEPRYNTDGTLAVLAPLVEGVPTSIARCHSTEFESDVVPAKPLIAWTQSVHDRIAIEIMRGCPQTCRFCHAGYTKRPLRWRSVERVLEIAEEAYWATGHDEIALLSLSTGDYPKLGELAEQINARFGPRRANISFPSLRVDKMLANIPSMGSAVRKGSVTLAVEAAHPEMREAIRKKVTDGDLLAGVRAAYEAGWNRVKLYFMAGFPGERPDDIRGIWELAYAVSQERRKTGKGPAAVSVSVGWLVPKPFTPLQWAAQPTSEYFEDVRDQLRAQALRRKSAVKIRTHDARASVLEAVLSRGDRRLGKVILAAWRHGARFDGWSECFDNQHWLAAYDETGVDPTFYAHRERPLDELLPWDHIGAHLGRDFLERAYRDLRERAENRAEA
ncbi:MAG: TIGR03960 family B12-binding radical SAM protein [Phycisphaerae bacterium]|nr:TIGR03960 family B12-binding radical SAM protein [Phycisphaerae bacterium]